MLRQNAFDDATSTMLLINHLADHRLLALSLPSLAGPSKPSPSYGRTTRIGRAIEVHAALIKALLLQNYYHRQRGCLSISFLYSYLVIVSF